MSYATFRVCARDFSRSLLRFLFLFWPCCPVCPCLLLFLCVFLPTVFRCRSRGPTGVRGGHTVVRLNGVKNYKLCTVHLLRAKRAAILARNLPHPAAWQGGAGFSHFWECVLVEHAKGSQYLPLLCMLWGPHLRRSHKQAFLIHSGKFGLPLFNLSGLLLGKRWGTVWAFAPLI